MIIHGKVITGLGLGAKLGYPTANLKLSFVQRLRTKLSFDRVSGVYAARATVDGATYNSALIIGARTEKGKPLVEVHLLDFSDDLRNQELEVEVLKKMSEIEMLEHDEGLKNKIEEDVKIIRAYFDALR